MKSKENVKEISLIRKDFLLKNLKCNKTSISEKNMLINGIDNKGITLVALVITIIVLLILAGITITMIINGDGIFKRAKNSVDKWSDAQKNEEDIVFNSYVSEINDYIENNSSNNHNTPEEQNDNCILSYDVALSKRIETVKDTEKMYDLTENTNNATLYNTNFDSNNEALVFNGSSSYAKLDLKSALSFPLTVEMDISTTSTKSEQIYYIDTNSKIALGYFDGIFICTTNTNYLKTYKVPSDFVDGNIKHIVVKYNTLNDYEVIVNGQVCEVLSYTNYWSSSSGSYIGKRSNGSYFNGNLYSFRIYNRILEETEYSGTNNKNNLIVEYDVDNANSFKDKEILHRLVDLVNDNNAECYNTEINSEGDGVIFNGSSSYLTLDLKSTLSFPLTIEMDISTSSTQNDQVFYIDTNSQTAFGYYDGIFICTANTEYLKTYKVPSGFLDGNIKHIEVKYNTLKDYEVFVNGQICQVSSHTNYWSSSSGSYIGRRSSGNYFNGTLYKFKIYNK